MHYRKYLNLLIVLLGLMCALLGAEEVTIGTGNQQARIPLDFYWRNSLFETLYFPDELGFDTGTISAIKFYNTFVTNNSSAPTRIWLGSTQQANLVAGYIPASALTLVFDGNINFPSGTNTINIPLSTPYTHVEGNLVMLVQRPWDEVWYSQNDVFKAQTVGNNRSRNIYSSSDEFDPANPPVGALSGQFPQTTFVYTPVSIVNDLSCYGLSGNTTPRVGSLASFGVNIKNNGNSSQTNYVVKLFQAGGTQLSSVNGVEIAPGEVQNVQLSWTPQAAGATSIYATVEMAGDEIAHNNQSLPLAIEVQPANTLSITVGEGDQNARIPIDFYKKNGMYQSLYFPAEIGAFGSIRAFTLYNNFVSNLTNKQLKVWMGSTTLNDLSGGWIPATQLTQVFDGTINFPVGENEITISLDSEYAYTEGNLVLFIQRPLDTVYYANTDFFKCQTVGVNRARNVYSDTTIYDPMNPGNVGSLTAQHPKISFHLAPLSTEPYFSLSPADGDFGTVLLDSSQTKNYHLTNAGGGALNIQNITLSGSEHFSLLDLPAFPYTLNNWDLLDFGVQYHPTAVGEHSATLSIIDDRGNRETVLLQLTGYTIDTNIHHLPYQQDFDSAIVPNLPLDWSSLISPHSNTAFVGTYSSAPYSAPNSVRIYNGSTAGVDVILVAPPLGSGMSVNNTQLRMMVKGVATTYTLKIGVMNDPQDAESFTEIQTISTSPAWSEVVIPFASYTGEGRFIAIKHGFGALGQSIYVDNVSIELDATSDLSSQALSGNLNPTVGLAANYSASIFNWGTQTETDYTVKLYSESGVELATAAGSAVEPNSSVNVTLVWTPTTAGVQSLYAKVFLAGDENSTNDQSPLLSVNVHPAGSVFHTIGLGTENARVPLDFNYKNSLSETIFFESEFDTFGWINEICLYNQFTSTNITNKPVKIWMGTTSQSNLVSGWIPASELDLVFNGMVNFPAGQNQINIPLQTPYLYNHGNLVVMINRPMDTQMYAGQDYFKAQTLGSNRARKAVSDNVNFNPISPQDAGTLSGQFAKTSFILQNQGLARLSGIVSAGGMPIEGATISILNSPFSQQSSASGAYIFQYLLPGTYSVQVSKEGYESQTQTVSLLANQETTQNFNLQISQTVVVSGTVYASDTPGIGLPGASIRLQGVAEYIAETNASGSFNIPSVLGGNIYQYSIFASGFDTISGTITVANLNYSMGDFTLEEMVLPPRQLRATANATGSEVSLSWLKPAAGNSASLVDEFEYESGGWLATANWGDLSGDWEWTDGYSAEDFVDTYGSNVVRPPDFAHSGTGLWGTKINTNYTNADGYSFLTKSFNFSNIPNPQLRFWSWENVFGEFDYCRVAVNGQVVWGPSWQYVDTQWTERVINLNNYGGSSYVQIQFQFFATASVAYAGWYIDDVYVGPARGDSFAALGDSPSRELSASLSESLDQDNDTSQRTIHGYKVWRLEPGHENTESLWILLTPQGTSSLELVDNSWASLPDGEYKWAVKALYSYNQVSNPAFSNTLRILRNDMAAQRITGNRYPSAGQNSEYVIQIKNMASVPVSGSAYTVKLFKGSIEVASAQGIDLAPESTADISIPWLPTETGDFVLLGKVSLPDDSNINNNSTPPLPITVLDSNLIGKTVGEGNQLARVPIDVYYRSSLNQYLLFPAELGNIDGTITGISLKSQFTQNVIDRPVKIWAGNTTQSGLTGGWFPSNQLTLVFDGVLSFPLGDGTINIPFDIPFEYQADQNLVLSFYLPWQTPAHDNTNYFRCQPGSAPNRSRNYSTNSNDLNPASPPANAGMVSAQFPQTTLFIIPNATGSLSGVVRNIDNEALANVQVRVQNNTYSTTTNADGFYEIQRILPGNYTAIFSVHAHQNLSQPFSISAQETTTLDATMVLMPTVTVSGTILASDTQAPLEAAVINLSGYADYNAISNAAGYFEMTGVYANFGYHYSIQRSGYAATTGEIEVGIINYSMGNITLTELTYPPHSVSAAMNADDTQAEINWYSPDPSILEIRESFEGESFPPLNWTQITTNNGAPNGLGVFPTWCRFHEVNLFGEPITPPDGIYQAGLRWEYNHQDEWLISPSFYCPPEAYLSFYSYVYHGSENNEHYYVKISSDNGHSWHVLWDASTLSGGWNIYAAPYVIDLSNYGGQQVKVAFQALDAPTLDGLWYDWFIDDIVISSANNEDLAHFARYLPAPATKAKAQMSLSLAPAAPLYNSSRRVEEGRVASEPVLAKQSATNKQRVLMGYKVWRLNLGQEEDESTWNLITQEIVNETFLVDSGWQNLINGYYRWAVKAYYSNDVPSVPAFSNTLQRVVETGMIAGIVRKANNAPLPGATISAAGRTATTSANGAYALVIPEGTHEVMCEAPGYQTQIVPEVVVYRNQTTTVNFQLPVSNEDEVSPAYKTELLTNYPNPFNPSTTLRYSLKEATSVELSIFNAKGQLVRKLVSGMQNAGKYQVVWNGKDELGSSVASGVYFYRLQAGEKRFTRKMLLMQ